MSSAAGGAETDAARNDAGHGRAAIPNRNHPQLPVTNVKEHQRLREELRTKSLDELVELNVELHGLFKQAISDRALRLRRAADREATLLKALDDVTQKQQEQSFRSGSNVGPRGTLSKFVHRPVEIRRRRSARFSTVTTSVGINRFDGEHRLAATAELKAPVITGLPPTGLESKHSNRFPGAPLPPPSSTTCGIAGTAPRTAGYMKLAQLFAKRGSGVGSRRSTGASVTSPSRIGGASRLPPKALTSTRLARPPGDLQANPDATSYQPARRGPPRIQLYWPAVDGEPPTVPDELCALLEKPHASNRLLELALTVPVPLEDCDSVDSVVDEDGQSLFQHCDSPSADSSRSSTRTRGAPVDPVEETSTDESQRPPYASIFSQSKLELSDVKLLEEIFNRRSDLLEPWFVRRKIPNQKPVLSESTTKPAGTSETKRQSLLGPTASQKFLIVLHCFRKAYDEVVKAPQLGPSTQASLGLRRAILACRLNKTQIQLLLDAIPDPEAHAGTRKLAEWNELVSRVRQYSTTNHPCSSSTEPQPTSKERVAALYDDEMFVLEAASIPDLHQRLQCLLLIASFDELASRLLDKIATVRTGLTILMHSPGVPKLLHFLLWIGNYVNEGTALGNKKWFRAATFRKAMEYRTANPNGRTLFHFLATHLGNALFTAQELAAVHKAAQASVIQTTQTVTHTAEAYKMIVEDCCRPPRLDACPTVKVQASASVGENQNEQTDELPNIGRTFIKDNRKRFLHLFKSFTECVKVYVQCVAQFGDIDAFLPIDKKIEDELNPGQRKFVPDILTVFSDFLAAYQATLKQMGLPSPPSTPQLSSYSLVLSTSTTGESTSPPLQELAKNTIIAAKSSPAGRAISLPICESLSDSPPNENRQPQRPTGELDLELQPSEAPVLPASPSIPHPSPRRTKQLVKLSGDAPDRLGASPCDAPLKKARTADSSSSNTADTTSPNPLSTTTPQEIDVPLISLATSTPLAGGVSVLAEPPPSFQQPLANALLGTFTSDRHDATSRDWPRDDHSVMFKGKKEPKAETPSLRTALAMAEAGVPFNEVSIRGPEFSKVPSVATQSAGCVGPTRRRRESLRAMADFLSSLDEHTTPTTRLWEKSSYSTRSIAGPKASGPARHRSVQLPQCGTATATAIRTADWKAGSQSSGSKPVLRYPCRSQPSGERSTSDTASSAAYPSTSTSGKPPRFARPTAATAISMQMLGRKAAVLGPASAPTSHDQNHAVVPPGNPATSNSNQGGESHPSGLQPSC